MFRAPNSEAMTRTPRTQVAGRRLRGCGRTTSIEATAAVLGLAVATFWVCAFFAGSGTQAAIATTLLMSVLVGVGAARVLETLCGRQWGPALGAMVALPAIAWGWSTFCSRGSTR